MWTNRIEKRAEKDLHRLPPADQSRILDYLEKRVARRADPRELGAALTGIFAGLWKYRVGHYRVLARIEDETVSVFVIRIGHRREVYR
jgi:mRNA interferase RelE/StbE